jgi:hypothetical protein
LAELKTLIRAHADAGMAHMQSCEGLFTGKDLVTSMMLNRSVNLLDGFAVMIERKNLVTAGPLVRIQLDNCLRFFALTLVENPNRVAERVIFGERLNALHARDGKQLSDAYLTKKFSKRFPWCRKLYNDGSGEVHLSQRHFGHAFKVKNKQQGVLGVKIGVGDENVPEEAYVRTVQTFAEITRTLLLLVKEDIVRREAAYAASKAEASRRARSGEVIPMPPPPDTGAELSPGG